MIHVAIGFRNYGKTDVSPNGSYVTTEWFHICYFPIYPVRRIRITPQIGRNLVVELPRTAASILKTYAFAVACLAWWCASFWIVFGRHSDYLDKDVGVFLAFMTVALLASIPFALLWFFRREAARAIQQNVKYDNR